MGATYQKMQRDLTLRNLSDNTHASYLGCCRNYVRHFMKAAEDMGLPEVESFLELLAKRGASISKRKRYVAGLRFLYGVTLGRPEVASKIPWPKVPQHKPDILSGTEVVQLFEAVTELKYRVIVMTAYSAGMRMREVCRLQVTDIDSKRGVIHIREGKGKKDRYVMLSPRLLKVLRRYWRIVRPKGAFLFPGREPETSITQQAVREALKTAVWKAGIKKRVTFHSLRHYTEPRIMRLANPDCVTCRVSRAAYVSTTLGIIRGSSGSSRGGPPDGSDGPRSYEAPFWRAPFPSGRGRHTGTSGWYRQTRGRGRER
jgi:site-specific recombinase XerD